MASMRHDLASAAGARPKKATAATRSIKISAGVVHRGRSRCVDWYPRVWGARSTMPSIVKAQRRSVKGMTARPAGSPRGDGHGDDGNDLGRVQLLRQKDISHQGGESRFQAEEHSVR